MTKTDESSFVICHNYKTPYKVQTETKHGLYYVTNMIHFSVNLYLNAQLVFQVERLLRRGVHCGMPFGYTFTREVRKILR